MATIDCFKAYDVRGKVPEQLNEDVAFRIGRAFARYFSCKNVAVGYDIRETSPILTDALANGLMASGCDVLDIGLCGTEEIYHATSHFKLDGGIMITASHNPIEYNGIKFVQTDSKPVSGDTGLFDVKKLAEENVFANPEKTGVRKPLVARDAYIEHLLTYINPATLKPLKIVSNPGNGGAGIVVDAIESYLPLEFIKIQHQADGTFPNGIPNPLLVERRQATIDAVVEQQADFGISWDGDFDRCFFFDENGRFIEGYYIVGLLAEAFLSKHSGAKIIHDPRLTWNTEEVVTAAGGVPIVSKTGHAFIKERMRQEDAIYGGEMSAHHYFRDFAYCDSGMIPWLLVAELISESGKSLSQLIDARMEAFPCSGEINFKVKDAQACVQHIREHFADQAQAVTDIDGLGMDCGDWRFSLRSSNTEPLLRLNLESRADRDLMARQTAVMTELIEKFS